MGFLNSQAKEKWFCHVDDDNYLNIPALLRLLTTFPTSRGEQHYLGKSSITRPLDLLDRRQTPNVPVRFMFGTGGAGVCLSRSVVENLEERKLVSGFRSIGDVIRLPDDVTLGYLVETVLGVKLTPVASLHSHLEPLRRLGPKDLGDMVTASYSVYEDTGERNTVQLGQDSHKDPTGFLEIHRLLLQSSIQSP